MLRIIQTRKFLLKIIVSFSTLLAIVTAALSVLLYSNFERVTLDSVAVTNSNYLRQISYSADYMRESAVSLIWNVYLNPKTIALMYQDENDYEELRKESIRLKQLVEINPFVHSIYVYNKKLNRYLGTGAEPLTLGSPFFDRAAADMLAKRAPVLTPAVRNIKEPYGEGTEKQVFTYVLYELVSSQDEVEGAVILNVKSEYLQNLTETLKQKSRQNQSEAFVLGPGGELITKPVDGVSPSFDESVRRSMLQEIKETESGHFTTSLNNQKYLITYTRSQPTGWYFMMLQPYSSVLANINQIKNITVQASLAVILAGVIAAVFMSRRIHSPLERLFKKILNIQGLKEPHRRRLDEIGMLEQLVSDSYGNMRMAERGRVIRNLVRNGATPGHQEVIGLAFAVDFQLPMIVILCRIDRYDRFVGTYNEKERDLLRYALTNVIQEHLTPEFPSECADLGEDRLIALVQVSPDTWEGQEQNFMRKLREAQDWCATHLGVSFTCVVSDMVTDAGEIPSLYGYLQQLSQYRYVKGHRSILREADTVDRPAETRISAIDETELLDALTNGQLPEAKEIFEHIVDKQRSLKYESVKSNLLQLAYVVYNRLADLEEYGSPHAQTDISRSLKELLDQETLDDVRLSMEKVFGQITELVLERKEKRSSTLAESVISYIHLHYADKGLCLESIADYHKYSKVYLSKIFREVVGQSVSDYITDYRISKVLDRIGETSNIDELLDESGVENKKYFFTLFKRKMGVSLREYRTKTVVQPLLEEKK